MGLSEKAALFVSQLNTFPRNAMIIMNNDAHLESFIQAEKFPLLVFTCDLEAFTIYL